MIYFKELFLTFLLCIPLTIKPVPQAFSRWRKSPTATGSIIIYHDRHFVDQFNPDISTNHYENLLLSLQTFEETTPTKKLHLFIESAFEGSDKTLLLMQNCITPYYSDLFMHQCLEKTLEKYFNNIIPLRVEYRHRQHIINTYLGISFRFKIEEFKDHSQRILVSIMLKAYEQYLQNVCFADTYEDELSAIKHYKENAANDLFLTIFTELETLLRREINTMCNTFKSLNLDEKKPIPGLYRDERKKYALIDAFNQLSDNYLLESIDARVLYNVMVTPEEETIAIFVGFEHAQKLEFLFSRLGYRCYKKIAFETPPKVSSSRYKEILATQRSCNFCLRKVKNIQRCSSCKNVYYCSRDCQIQDWRQGHNNLCKK